MFTGIVETTGKIVSMKKLGTNIRFLVRPNQKGYLKDIKIGDSISINGACMTVTTKRDGSFTFDTIAESLKKTNLGTLEVNSFVNLERAMKAGSRFDGHFVQGHVDTTGKITRINKLEGSWEIFIEFSKALAKSVIYVGSISVNGISLTVAEILTQGRSKTCIKIAIIPHTLEVTNLGSAKVGDLVNIEFDMIGKYINRIIELNKLK
jgi:riboflavin synthase